MPEPDNIKDALKAMFQYGELSSEITSLKSKQEVSEHECNSKMHGNAKACKFSTGAESEILRKEQKQREARQSIGSLFDNL